MGVYINMEMPTHCMDCPFMVSRDNDDCILQSDEANENFENWEQMKDGCPLSPVPPHGRLVDADKLMQEMRLFIKENMLSRDDARELLETIDAAPTVIEKEEVYSQYTDTAGNFHWCGTHSGEHTVKAKEGE